MIYKEKYPLSSMEQHLVVPKRCFKCGNVFDLDYDIEQEGLDFLNQKQSSVPAEFFCYYCRDKPSENAELAINKDLMITEELLNDEEYPE